MRYLFCAMTTPGHLFPMVGLALELQRRGHEVAFATGCSADPVLHDAGLPRIAGGDREGTTFEMKRWAPPLTVALDVKHIERAVRGFRPDALVSSLFAIGALIVRERTGLPVCVVGTMAYLWPRRTAGQILFPGCERLASWRFGQMAETLDRARAVFGLRAPHDPSRPYPLLGDVFLLRSVPELESNVTSLPPEVRVVGACEWAPPSDVGAAWQRLAEQSPGRGPIIYVHQGQTFGQPSFWPVLVEALGDRPVRVFASVGRMDSPVGVVPKNFVVQAHVPQSAVLPRADLVVCGGHSSVVLGALTHGLPMVVLPAQGGEMPDNTARLERAGCAARLDPATATPTVLRAAVDAALRDNALRQNARCMREAFQRFDGFHAAAEAVEHVVSPVTPAVDAAAL